MRSKYYTPFYKARLKWIPHSKSGASKSRPLWAAHTRIGNVWEYPPRGGKEVCQIAHTSYSKHQIPTDHSDVTISQQPFLFNDISFFPNTPATKN